MRLKTDRLTIRPLTMDDADDMHALFSIPEVMQPLGMAPAFVSMEQTRAQLQSWIDKGTHHAITLADCGTVVGYIAINPDSEQNRSDTRELGFALHPDYQRHGYMTEAILAVLDALREAGIRYVWACCFTDNIASKAVIERCGFPFIRKGGYTVESQRKTYSSLEYCMDLKPAEQR